MIKDIKKRKLLPSNTVIACTNLIKEDTLYLILQLINLVPIIIFSSLILSLIITIIFIIIHKFFLLKRTPTNVRLLFFKNFILMAYLLIAFSVLFPSWSTNDVNGIFIPINLIPFKGIIEDTRRGNYVQVIGNFFVFIPLPIVISLFVRSLKTIIYMSIIITVFIEPIQLLINIITKFPNNVIDVDDLILNLIGCLVGIFIIMLMPSYKRDGAN